MPDPYWRHECGDTGTVDSPEPVCGRCGIEGRFVGWALRRFESMARFQYITGLKPIGDHLPAVSDLLRRASVRCSRCGGVGLLCIDASTCFRCASCEGVGLVWTLSPDEVDAELRAIAQEFPNAVARPTPGFLGCVIVQDLARQEMIVVPPGGKVPRPITPRKLDATAVQEAFRQAEGELGTEWKLKGRGHCRRVSLARQHSAAARRGAPGSWTRVTPHGNWFRRIVMARPIVEKAAELLDVPVEQLITQEFSTSSRHRSVP